MKPSAPARLNIANSRALSTMPTPSRDEMPRMTLFQNAPLACHQIAASV
jgi:hypothetical protein